MSATAFDVDAILERIERLPPDQQREADALLASLHIIRPHTEYQTDPIGWAVDKLGIPEHTLRWSMNAGYDRHQWDGDTDPLVAIAEALRDWQSVGCESGTGTGKSFWIAVLILWFQACWEGARVFTFAPKEDQLRLYIWMEIGKLWSRYQAWFPSAELTDLCIRMRGGTDDSWGARGISTGIRAGETVNVKAAGQHAEHMLLVYEETPGIAHSVMEAGENTCTAPHNLRVAIGNPDHQLDALHRFCTSPRVRHVRMSALDHPNVVTGNASLIPGAISRVSIETRKEKYGDTDPVYLSRVRGISPEQAANSLIRLEWLRRAAARWLARKENGTLPTVVTGKGVDAANSQHGDSASICDFGENAVIRHEAFPCPDSNVLGAQIVMEANRHGLPGARIGVDAIGVGAGTVNEARRQGMIVQALYAGGKPMQMAEKAPDGRLVEWSPDVNQFKNLRGQGLWQLREDFRTDQIDVPEDTELWEELVAHTFEDHDKVTIVLPKDDVKALIGRSPDKSDSLWMANWVRKRAVRAPEKVREQGRTLGYDFAAKRPATEPTAEDEVAKALGFQRAHGPQGSRYAIPHRRGR